MDKVIGRALFDGLTLLGGRGMTLAGFARRGEVNVYTGAERVRG